MTDSAPAKPPSFLKELVAGGVAGALGKTSVAPLERTKILIQTGKSPSSRVDHVLRFMYKADGVRGFFKGNGASVARIVPYAAIHFSTYERVRTAVVQSLGPAARGAGGTPGRPPVWVDLVAGSASGAIAVSMTYPLDLVRTRMAWSMEQAAAAGSRGIWQTFAHVARTEGAAGLYRGVTPTLLGILPYSGIKFYTFQKLKRWWRDAHASEAARAGKPPLTVTLLAGGAAGLVAQTVTYPMDIVRRRMQVEALGDGQAARHLSMAAHARAIVREFGPRGLFRGLLINYMKVVPSTAVGFTIYDLAKHALQLENHL